MSWFWIAIASVLSGTLGAMGLGGGGILLLVLVWAGWPQMTAQGINLLMILPVGLLGLYFHRKNGLTDGKAAWPLLLGGLPGVLLYKITNTADSMIGHRTPRHEAFGWAAARLDDLLNLIPARLTAALIALAHGRRDAARPILRDAPLHRSPNAGWPESALAPVLNVALSGPRSYNGVRRHYPWVWPEGRRDPGPEDIDAAADALWRVWAALLVVAVLVALA